MNVLIAIDSFKGSLSSMQAGQAAAEGIKRVYPDAEEDKLPDGVRVLWMLLSAVWAERCSIFR